MYNDEGSLRVSAHAPSERNVVTQGQLFVCENGADMTILLYFNAKRGTEYVLKPKVPPAKSSCENSDGIGVRVVNFATPKVWCNEHSVFVLKH